MSRGDWFQTFTGVEFYPADPRPEDIHIEDIAHALAHQCRFAGHTREFYSVAQHSVLVSLHVPPHLALDGLLHDASEAYCQDLIRPLKHNPALAGYREIEARVEQAIATRFKLSWPWHPEVKKADDRALMTERRDILPVHRDWKMKAEPFTAAIRCWPPEIAKFMFLNRFQELTR
jgi:5'-deoxynucleotidase YfbR-like HD superfamily hydrolase